MWLPPFLRRFVKKLDLMLFYKGFINKGDLCFDIGANNGERTAAMLALGARVIAVEPQSTCVEVLKKKFGKNKRVTVVQAAVGDRLGSANLKLCAETSECATLSDDFVKAYGEISNLHWTTHEQVQMLTLDALINQYGLPRFCKIDVEGYESKVIAGLHQPIDCISIEFNQHLLSDTYRAMRELSELAKYETNFIEYENLNFVNYDWLGLSFFCEQMDEFFPPELLTGEIFMRRF